MFNWCGKLATILLLNVTNVSSIGNFTGCKSLVYIRFEGTIPVSLGFSASPLDAESAKGVINRLINYSGTAKEFSYTVTFSSTTWSYLDAEGDTASPNGNSWREYINDLGWNAS